MKVHMMLADMANTERGKLNVIGGLIQQIPPQYPHLSVVATVEFPWESAYGQSELALSLRNSDEGNVIGPLPMTVDFTDLGDRPLGEPASVVLIWNFPSLQLPAGKYSWQLAINGNSDYWTVPLQVE